jgi:hypothetical protein
MPDQYEITGRVSQDLDLLAQLVKLGTQTAVDSDDPATVAAHLQTIRALGRSLVAKAEEITKHADVISQEILPTMFFNKRLKTANFVGVGRVTINQKWSAVILNPEKAFAYLRAQGNGGVIKETIHHETLGALAREAAIDLKQPLPDDLFKVSTVNYTSITKV